MQPGLRGRGILSRIESRTRGSCTPSERRRSGGPCGKEPQRAAREVLRRTAHGDRLLARVNPANRLEPPASRFRDCRERVFELILLLRRMWRSHCGRVELFGDREGPGETEK